MVKRGMVAGIPIAIGYFPVAVTFGLTALAMGLNETEAILASMLIFAGAAQFALVNLLCSPVNATLIPIFLNLRHLIYSCIISRRLKVAKPFLTAFGLTDEVFAMSFKGDDEKFVWGLALIAYLAWVLGTVIGVLGGSIIVSNEMIYPSLVFAFPALFFILLISNVKGWHLVSALLGGFIALIFHFYDYSSFGILLAGILTPLIVSTLKRWFK
jgi:4-azaleucine resistance transporter AzlC